MSLWIIPVLVKCDAHELDSVKNKINIALKSYFSRIDLAQPINPEWEKAENSPIAEIKEQTMMLIPNPEYEKATHDIEFGNLKTINSGPSPTLPDSIQPE